MPFSLNRVPFTKLIFIALNIGISLLSFLRSFIFLKQLGFYELGLVSIFQTIILLVSFSQIGVINGGYRAYAGAKKYYRQMVNDFIFSFFLIISVSTATIAALIFLMNGTPAFSGHIFIFLLGTIAGLFSLVTLYLTNTLLADQKIKEVNIINFISNLLGYSSLILVIYHPLFALASFIIQPFAFIVLAFIFDRSVIPKRFLLSQSIFSFLLRLGFIPYLTALFAYVNLQVERWTIVYVLGIETFGRFYLAIAFTSLFALFPASVNNLYFPRMVKFYSDGNINEFNRLLKRYTYVLLTYCLLTAVLVPLLAGLVIQEFFPQHAPNLQYVYYILPGLVAITLVNPYLVHFNASLRLNPLLISYGASTLSIIIMITFLYFFNSISLESVAIADSVANVFLALFILVYFYFDRKRVKTSVEIG